MTDPRTRMTVLAPWVADEHERLTPTCLVAPDGETTCGAPATHRVQFVPLAPDHGLNEGPVTFACAEHEPPLRAHLAVRKIRAVRQP